jgi:hypothetical protein
MQESRGTIPYIPPLLSEDNWDVTKKWFYSPETSLQVVPSLIIAALLISRGLLKGQC